MERNASVSKDLCLTVPLESKVHDYSPWLLELARTSYSQPDLSDSRRRENPVSNVNLLNSFVHPEKKYVRHCYRFTFHNAIRNTDAKKMEKEIRDVLAHNLLEGMSL